MESLHQDEHFEKNTFWIEWKLRPLWPVECFMGITLKRPVFWLILAIWGGERVKKPRYQVNSHPLGPQGPIRIKNFGMFEIFRKTHLDTGLLLLEECFFISDIFFLFLFDLFFISIGLNCCELGFKRLPCLSKVLIQLINCFENTKWDSLDIQHRSI